MRLDVGAKYGVHAREMALALFLEPVEHIAVDAKMDRRFAGRHYDAGMFPETVV
jgi:hypothetical protein